MKKFGEIVKPEDRGKLLGASAKIEDLVGVPVEVLKADIFDSVMQGGTKCMSLQVRKAEKRRTTNGAVEYVDDTVYLLHTGSTVLMEQIDKYGDQIPFEATIQKARSGKSGRGYYMFE